MRRLTKVLGNIKVPPRETLHSIGKIKGIREYKSPIPVKLYIQLGRLTKVLGNIKVPTPVKLYIQLGRSKSHPRQTLHSIAKINKEGSDDDCDDDDDDDVERTRTGPYAVRSDLEQQVNYNAKISIFYHVFSYEEGGPGGCKTRCLTVTL